MNATTVFNIHVNETFRSWKRIHRMRNALSACKGYAPTVRNAPRIQTYVMGADGLQHCGPSILVGDRLKALRSLIVEWHRWARSQSIVSPTAPVADHAKRPATHICTEENGKQTWYRVTRFHVVPM